MSAQAVSNPSMVALALTLLVSSVGTLMAEEQVPYPELDTKGYCAASVASVVDEAERRAEEGRCIFNELTLKEAIRPYWRYVPERGQKNLVTKYFREVENQTYMTVRGTIASAVGEACMINKTLVCQPPK